MRKRLLLIGAAIVGLACVVVLVLAMLPPRPGVTKANFDRIEKGMTLVEVERLFGRPRDESAAREDHRIDMWRTVSGKWGQDGANIWFDNDGHAFHLMWHEEPEPWVFRIHRWLGLP